MSAEEAILAQERDKYERMWTFAAYRGNRANVPQARRFAKMVRMPKGSSVLDLGCGPGYAARRLHDLGMRVVALDIASNALAPENAGLFEFRLGSAWDLPADLACDFGFCTDVMEHIPPEKVGATLAALRRATRRETYFEVSMRKDGCGRLIGDVLHLTVRPVEWWEAELGKHWRAVELISIDFRAKSAVFLAG